MLTTLKRVLLKSGNTDSAATISNAGYLYIENGKINAKGAAYSAGIWNQEDATLDMIGGTIVTAEDKVWGINNAGTATILDGVFEHYGYFWW